MEGLLTGILGLLTFMLLGLLVGAGVGAVWDVAWVLGCVGGGGHASVKPHRPLCVGNAQ